MVLLESILENDSLLEEVSFTSGNGLMKFKLEDKMILGDDWVHC